jgi:hypothetical protein
MKTPRNIGGSILPSSSPQVLSPLPFREGALVVRPLVEADTHGLFYDRGEFSSLLCTHSNGYSCRALAERLTNGNADRVREQAEYVLRCGGTCREMEAILELLKPGAPVA